MTLGRSGAFGCGMCNAASATARVSEIRQTKALINFIESGAVNRGSVSRVLLIPELLFYSPSLLRKLPFAKNVAAVIVYAGFPADASATEGADTPDAISTDAANPNADFSLPMKDTSFFYNNGTGFRTTAAQFNFYPFNIFRVNSTVADRIRKRVRKFQPESDEAEANSAAVLDDAKSSDLTARYVVKSIGRMYACPEDAKEQLEKNSVETSQVAPGFTLPNSTQCLKDNTCLPIGGQSVWSSLGVLQAPKKKDILAITAPMDSTALFHDLAQGAAAEISSLATLMAVAEAVAKYRRGPGKGKPMLRQPVYFAWSAQSWGFSGSSRFLTDVKEFECVEEKVRFGKVSGCVRPYKGSTRFKDLVGADWSVLNLNSIIDPGPDPREDVAPVIAEPNRGFFLHGRPAVTTTLRDILLASFPANGNVSGASNSKNRFVPPDASQSFAQFADADAEVVSLANFESVFSNKLYHSQYDNVRRIPESARQPLYDAAQGVARTVIAMCFGDTNPKVSIATETIDSFIGCLTSNWSTTPCELSELYQEADMHKDGPQKGRPGNFAGLFVPDLVAQNYSANPAWKTDLVRSFLAYQNRFDEGGDCTDSKECAGFQETLNGLPESDIFRVALCSRGKCVASDTFLHDSYGTGIKTTAGFAANETAENKDKPQFEVDPDKFDAAPGGVNEGEEADEPGAPVFTESFWDEDLGICGFMEDSTAFGFTILFGGIAVNMLSFVIAWLLGRKLLARKVSEDDEPLLGDSGHSNSNGQVAVEV